MVSMIPKSAFQGSFLPFIWSSLMARIYRASFTWNEIAICSGEPLCVLNAVVSLHIPPPLPTDPFQRQPARVDGFVQTCSRGFRHVLRGRSLSQI